MPLSAAGPSLSGVAGAQIDLHDTASLQRGARTFVNYCHSCHSARYHRYNRMARDLGLSEEQLQENLILTTDEEGQPNRPGSVMEVASNDAYSEQIFGILPPDLTLVARARGADWIFHYMKSFYRDDSRPFGVNNMLFPNVSMPHVLLSQQGLYKRAEKADGTPLDHLERDTPGSLDAEQYDQLVNDLVNFLVYLGDPSQKQRRRIGVYVLLYLALFAVLAYLLKREYWKDVYRRRR